MCYPDVQDIGELDKGERATWIRIREGLLQGNKAAIEALKTTVKVLDKQVDAEIKDIQRAADRGAQGHGGATTAQESTSRTAQRGGHKTA